MDRLMESSKGNHHQPPKRHHASIRKKRKIHFSGRRESLADARLLGGPIYPPSAGSRVAVWPSRNTIASHLREWEVAPQPVGPMPATAAAQGQAAQDEAQPLLLLLLAQPAREAQKTYEPGIFIFLYLSIVFKKKSHKISFVAVSHNAPIHHRRHSNRTVGQPAKFSGSLSGAGLGQRPAD